MAAKGWRAYFTFTRKERTGIWVLLLLIGIVYVAPSFLPERKSVYLEYGTDSLQQKVSAKKTAISSNELRIIQKEDVKTPEEPAGTATLFYFDPNILDKNGWQQLGIRERTIRTIQNFRAKGGKFRQPADIRKIYGLSENECEKLIPFIRIAVQQTPPQQIIHPYNKKAYAQETQKDFSVRKPVLRTIDINRADSADWEQLPAIGSRLASRIVFFRERLGGFHDVTQVAETFGISDSAFDVIKPYLTLPESPLRKININTADANTLRNHPYIKWNLSNAIVQYRNQHGKFTDHQQLLAIAVITPAVYQKLAPYLLIE